MAERPIVRVITSTPLSVCAAACAWLAAGDALAAYQFDATEAAYDATHLDRMTSEQLLANVRVASPCSARWADMTGDDQARYCAQCLKHVYNLSGMTAEAASDLIREKEGKLCVRFYQRDDGTVLTADCPIGAAAVWRRVKRLAAAAVALLCSSVAASIWAGSSGQRTETRPRPKVYEAWDEAVSAVREFVNPKPPPETMGKMCAPPPPKRPPPNSTPPTSPPKSSPPSQRVN